MNTIEQRVTDLAGPLAASLGLSLWGVQVLVGPRSIVRVFAEGEDGISVDQCADLSRLLGLSLEVEDVVEEAYVLEVSSPGLERIFFTQEQLAAAAGQPVEITLTRAEPTYPGRRKFAGILTVVEGDCVILEDTLTGVPLAVSLPYAAIKKAKALYIEPEKILPGKGKKNTPKASTGFPEGCLEGQDAEGFGADEFDVEEFIEDESAALP